MAWRQEEKERRMVVVVVRRRTFNNSAHDISCAILLTVAKLGIDDFHLSLTSQIRRLFTRLKTE